MKEERLPTQDETIKSIMDDEGLENGDCENRLLWKRKTTTARKIRRNCDPAQCSKIFAGAAALFADQ
jgi:hypothetical protein